MKYNATIEFLGAGRAIVAFTDARGGWAGACRIDIKSPSREALYEAGYLHARAGAVAKGGTLETFREFTP